ncbi:MAG TPA: DNA repair protein RecN [Candidatus Marinimicrobia bacterium]|nr:DNA repair protein RecN [Candidatus Neomarinimicrobiota bacterium]
MLKRLFIENFAIVKELEIELDSGLTVITGETGAGKSIIIDALGLALGDRASLSMIRQGENQSVIEADFQILKDCKPLENWFRENEISPRPNISIRRELLLQGKSRAFVNETFVSQQALKSLGMLLVEMHGQHEHQRLLDELSHQSYYDTWLKEPALFEEYTTAYIHFEKHITELQNLEKQRDSMVKEAELEAFQLQELSAVNPLAGELDELEKEQAILENSQLLAESAAEAASLLYENEESFSAELTRLIKLLEKAAQIDAEIQPYLEELRSAQITCAETGRSLGRYRDNVSHDPQRLEWIQRRLHSFQSLMRKYRRDYEEIVDYYEQLKDKSRSENNYDERIARQKKKLEEARSALKNAALALHNLRISKLADFRNRVEAILHRLGMDKARFNLAFHPLQPQNHRFIIIDGKKLGISPKGFEQLSFEIITNPGEHFKPLQEVASGGELSRITLALKSLLSDEDNTPTLIFDEADAGVSGRIARIVGEQIRALSENHQVLCITHLPQIASLGDQHFAVVKSYAGDYAETSLKKLKNDERITEIAKLLEAKSVTKTTLQAAKELLNTN